MATAKKLQKSPLPILSHHIVTPPLDQWDQISSEHCYPKLMAHWSSTGTPLPTFHLLKTKDIHDISTQQEEKYDISQIIFILWVYSRYVWCGLNIWKHILATPKVKYVFGEFLILSKDIY